MILFASQRLSEKFCRVEETRYLAQRRGDAKKTNLTNKPRGLSLPASILLTARRDDVLQTQVGDQVAVVLEGVGGAQVEQAQARVRLAE